MFFSVIIPTYNRARLLRETLDSVFAQTFRDFEIVVIDDGSTDETASVIAGYAEQIRGFRQPNQGPGAARNLGIGEATGEYIAFLDSDDLWFPWTLEMIENCIELYKSPSMVALKADDFANANDLAKLRRQDLEARWFPDYMAAAQRQNHVLLTCSSVVVRSAELRRSGGFTDDNCNAEDLDLWMRLGDAPGFVEIKSPVCCGYRRHSRSETANLRKTHSGLRVMINRELKNIYPGGRKRAAERRKIITRHVRPSSLALAKCGEWMLALDLYAGTWRWNLKSRRVKYLLGFWLYFWGGRLGLPKWGR